MSRIFVAMSGGVDSSVAAALLVEQGHDVVGVTMRLVTGAGPDGSCKSQELARTARRVCDHIGIPHYTFEMTDAFRAAVVSPFCDSYAMGLTPNPCVQCNELVKFGELLRRVRLQDAEFLATGHYAQVVRDTTGAARLARATDPSKDQSYFLYRIGPDVLESVLFPLGGMLKTEVRAMATRLGLPSADIPDSQEICFTPSGSHASLVGQFRPDALLPGPILDVRSGEQLGMHMGIAGYTVGQRRGLGIGGPGTWYVTDVNAATNTVYVGDADSLDVSDLVLSEAVWWDTLLPERVSVRVRHRASDVIGTAEWGTVEPAGVSPWTGGERRLFVSLDEPVRGAAPGQSVVCYVGDVVAGGGVLSEAR